MGILNEKVTERRDELIRALNRSGITHSSHGRYITGLPLSELEWMHVESINEAMRVFGSDVNEKVH